MMLRPLITIALLCAFVAPVAAGDGNPFERREQQVRSRARFFKKITVDRDYSGEWVVSRNRRVTAFLDLADRRHPRYRGQPSTSAKIHLLVVPNVPREHIGKTMGAKISEGDLKDTLAVLRAAKSIARRLGVVKPQVYINSESNIGVGYLHVHVVGSLPAHRKLPRLAATGRK